MALKAPVKSIVLVCAGLCDILEMVIFSIAVNSLELRSGNG